MKKSNTKSDPIVEISHFVYKSVVDLSEIISDDSKTQETIQVAIFSVTGAVGGLLLYFRTKNKDQLSPIK